MRLDRRVEQLGLDRLECLRVPASSAPIADLAPGSSEPAQKGASRLSYCRYRMAGGAESCNFANGIVANHLPADGGGARRRGWASVAPADNRRRSGGDTRPRYCRAGRRNR